MKRSVSRFPQVLAILSLAILATASALAQTVTILHDFPATADDGNLPWSPLIFDDQDNLYGVTRYGGNDLGAAGPGKGIIYEISASGDETILHAFNGPDGDGVNPLGPIVRFHGSLYGTTLGGSTNRKCTVHGGCGTIYRLTNGKITILHSFTSLEGTSPAGVARDSSGNLFGATLYGGVGTPTPACPSQGCGTIFQYSQRKESVLYTFLGQPDGETPNGELLLDSAGNIFGTTRFGGAFNHGTVFELAPKGDGTWTENLLYSFRGDTDGSEPYGGVVMDAKGDLYGTTFSGGLRSNCGFQKRKLGCGAIYKMVRNTDGSWSERSVYLFGGKDVDGIFPIGDLVIDKQGNLYGVTNAAIGSISGNFVWSTAFELTTDGTEILVATFMHDGTTGFWPVSGLTLGASGNLYGTTTEGSANGYGTVFKITP
jgi:uncharacterized repeat protein (TIGR03803 family)